MPISPVKITLYLVFIFGTFLIQIKANENWNQFRGPNGSGVASKNFKPPVKINKNNITWSVEIPEGLSSPIIYGDKIFLTGVKNNKLLTLCINRNSGELLWEKFSPDCQIEKVHKTSSPASSTPYVDSKQLYVYFGSYGLLCYDHDGKEKWSRPIPTPKSLYGMSTSPLGYEDTIILVLDNDSNITKSRLSQSKIIAFDKSNGVTKWSAERPHHRSGWSSPII